MRLRILGLAIGLGMMLAWGPCPEAGAQIATSGLGNDPFSLYYGYYLPHQAAIAAQTTPLDTINAITAARQYTASTDRAALYDPISPYAQDESDPSRPFGDRRGAERLARPHVYQRSPGSSTARGGGPALYFNRTVNRTTQYYPEMRVGRGPNRNLAVTRRGIGGGGGGFGTPSLSPQSNLR